MKRFTASRGCSDQFLTLVEIKTGVLLPQAANHQHASKHNMGPRRKLGSRSDATSIRNHPSKSSIQSELLSYSEASIFIAKINSEDAPIPMMKAFSKGFRFHSNAHQQ